MDPDVLEAFFESVPEAFAVVGENLCIIRQNAAFKRLLEKTGCEEAFTRQLTDGGPLYVSCEAVLKDEATRLFSVQGDKKAKSQLFGKIFPVYSGTKKAAGIVLKEADADVAEVENALRARTHQVRELQREMEAFSYSVSHDLRAPVRAVMGFSQALQHELGESLAKQSAEYVIRVRQSAQRIGELIDLLLKFSRAARNEPVKELVNLTEVGRAVAKEVETRANGPAGEWIIKPGMTAKADEKYVRETLRVLFENALKFSQGKPNARIEFGSRVEGGETQFYVKDNGAGYDPAYADKLFSPLQRLHAADEFPGEGIGLAIARKVVGKMGGRIWGESSVGEGATFFFTL